MYTFKPNEGTQMTKKIDAAIDFAHQHKDEFLKELIVFCALPSISTGTENEAVMAETAEWVAKKLKSIGVENVKVMETARHPLVYGDHLHAGPDAPAEHRLQAEGRRVQYRGKERGDVGDHGFGRSTRVRSHRPE